MNGLKVEDHMVHFAFSNILGDVKNAKPHFYDVRSPPLRICMSISCYFDGLLMVFMGFAYLEVVFSLRLGITIIWVGSNFGCV